MRATHLIFLALCTALVCTLLFWVARRRDALLPAARAFAAAAAVLAYGAALLLVAPALNGTLPFTWLSNRSTAVQLLVAELMPLIIISVVVIPHRFARRAVIAPICTLGLCVASLAITNKGALFGAIAELCRRTQQPMAHGWGVHVPPADRFVGYAVATALAVLLAIPLMERHKTLT